MECYLNCQPFWELWQIFLVLNKVHIHIFFMYPIVFVQYFSEKIDLETDETTLY